MNPIQNRVNNVEFLKVEPNVAVLLQNRAVILK